jgi:predicted amidohydrolase YtcJ
MRVCPFIILLVVIVNPAHATGSVDTLFIGQFVTLDPKMPHAEAIAVRNGVISAVGTRAELEGFAGPAVRRVQIPGVTLPGLTDAHTHPLDIGTLLEGLDGFGLSKEEIVRRVAKMAATAPSREWITGDRWDQSTWRDTSLPGARDLDAASGKHPVFLLRIDGHSAWVNQRALDLAGITRDTKDPPDGKILRDASGAPTGIISDGAKDLVTRHIPPLAPRAIERRLRASFAQFVKWGLTSIHDAGEDGPVIDVYRDMARRGVIPLRIYLMANSTEPTITQILARGPEVGLGGGFLTIRSFKVVMDGSLGSHSAELSAPYTDEPLTTGTVVTTDEIIDDVIARAVRKGFQVNSHAIGDRANHRLLDAYERAGPAARALRFRDEHASMLDDEDLARMAKLGIIASIQPNFVGEHARWGTDRIGTGRLPWLLRYKDMIVSGARIATGTDYPDDAGDPVTTLYCMVTERGANGLPAGGFRPDQRVDVDTALRAATEGAAYAAFQEDHLGSLTIGRLADFTTLSGDPYTTAPDKLRSLRVLRTVVAGKIRFQAPH